MKERRIVVLSIALILALMLGCASASADSKRMEEAAALVMDIPTVQYFTSEAVPEADVERILQAGVNAPSAMNTQPWHFTAVTDAAVLEEIASGMSFGGPMSAPGGAGFPGGMTPPDGGAGFPGGMTPPDSGAGFPGGMTPPAGSGAADGFQPSENSEAPKAPAMGNKAGIADAPLAIIVSCVPGQELNAGLAVQNMSAEAQLLGYGSKVISSPTIALNGERRAEFAELLGIPEGQSAVAVLLVGYEDTTVDTTLDGYTGATSRSPMSEKVSYVK